MMMMMLCAPTKNDLDASFSFPDRRHSPYAEVYPGVRVPSPLEYLSFITPCSQKCIEECHASRHFENGGERL